MSNFVLETTNVQGVPLSEDYYISSYGECNWDNTNPAGVCPDSFFAGTTSGLNNSELLHGQQIDGKLLVLPLHWLLWFPCI